ncbi:MAG: DUF3307 domain-containing protein [Euryarchaeota archaeon]|jgi:hypothetical protein|nr:DUF3307 domain-containing protein [Euryarchaeota archaeon]
MTERILFLLFIKHAIADLGLQSQFLWGRTSSKYNYFGCHVHYLHHAIGTFLVFLLVDLRTACMAMVLDYVAHWHIDFLKHRTQVYMNWDRKDKAWWWLAATDQLLHFATYYLLVIYLL